MTRIMKTSIAALFGASMLATPVLAQTDNANPSDMPSQTGEALELDTGVEAGADVDTGMTAAIEPDFESAMSRVGDSEAAAAITAMPNVGEVRIVSMSTLKDSDEARLDQAMGESEATMNELRAAVEANQAISAELAANSMAASDVIAADVAVDGSVIIYTR